MNDALEVTLRSVGVLAAFLVPSTRRLQRDAVTATAPGSRAEPAPAVEA